MPLTMEPCHGQAYVARSGPEHNRHGDPYEIACTVECKGEVATVKGVVAKDGRLTRATLRELTEALLDLGIRKLRIERRRDGRVAMHEWEIG